MGRSAGAGPTGWRSELMLELDERLEQEHVGYRRTLMHPAHAKIHDTTPFSKRDDGISTMMPC